MISYFLKRCFLVLGLSLLFVSCVQDDAFNTEIEPVSHAPRFTLQKITSPNLKANPRLYKTIDELSSSVGSIDNDLTLAKKVYNAEQDFIVDTSIANYIEYGDYHSYTFPVIRPTDNGLTENLLLSLQADGSYKALLFTYDLTDAEKTLLQNNALVDLEGKVSMQVHDDQWANTILAKTEYELGNGVCLDIREEYEMCCSNTHSSQDVREGQTCNCEQQPTATYLTVTVGPCSNGGGGGGRGNTDVNTDGPIPNNHGNIGLLGGNVGGGQNTNPNGNINIPSGNDINNPNNTQQENSNCLQTNSNGDCVNNVTAPLVLIRPSSTQLINLLDLDISTDSEVINWINNPVNVNIVDAILNVLEYDEIEEDILFIKEAIENLMSFSPSNYPGKEDGLPFYWWNNDDLIENIIQDPYETWKKLSAREKQLAKMYPIEALKINKNKTIAFEKTAQYFGNTPQNLNGKADAFRHAFFQAINTQDINQYKAKMFADAHESEVPNRWIKEKQMDLFNNNIGIDLIVSENLYNTDVNTIASMINNLVTEGELVYLSPIDYSGYNTFNSPFWDNSATIEPNDGTHGITPSTILIPTNE